MRRILVTVMVTLSLLSVPEAARADVGRAWFSAQQYSAAVGSIVPIVATFEGDTISLGAPMPVVIVPNEFSAQQSSSCRAQRKFISNTSQVEFTDCYLTQSSYDATSMAVTPVLPDVGQYESYLLEMTIMLLVTDAAVPGASYNVTIPDTLSGYGNYRSAISAAVVVLPSQEVQPTTPPIESESQAYLVMSPDAVRMSPSGQADFLIQSILYGGGTLSRFNLEIQIPPGLEIVSGPFCEPRSSTPSRSKLCTFSGEEVSGGRRILRVSPGSSESGADGVYFTVGYRNEAPVDFAQIIASIEPDPDADWTTSGLSYSNITAVSEDDLYAGNRSAPGGAIELIDFDVFPAGCGDDRFFPGKALQLVPWGGDGVTLPVFLSQGELSESTSEVASDSCYFRILAPEATRDTVYVLMDGDCRACAIGIFAWGENADPIAIIQTNP